MTDNDIIKVLEWCEQFENNIVFKGNGDKKCALALQMMVVIKHALKNYNRQNAEIEALKLINSTYVATANEIRELAISEFKVKLRKRLCTRDTPSFVFNFINATIKEMVGET